MERYAAVEFFRDSSKTVFIVPIEEIKNFSHEDLTVPVLVEVPGNSSFKFPSENGLEVARILEISDDLDLLKDNGYKFREKRLQEEMFNEIGSEMHREKSSTSQSSIEQFSPNSQGRSEIENNLSIITHSKLNYGSDTESTGDRRDDPFENTVNDIESAEHPKSRKSLFEDIPSTSKQVEDSESKQSKIESILKKDEKSDDIKREKKRTKAKKSIDDGNESDEYQELSKNKPNYHEWTDSNNIKMIHLRYGVSIPLGLWDNIKRSSNPSIFTRNLSRAIWTPYVLMNRAFRLDICKQGRLERSPRKPLTPSKRAVLKKCYSDFLELRYPKKKGKYEKKWSSYLRIYINNLISKEIKKKREVKNSSPSSSDQDD